MNYLFANLIDGGHVIIYMDDILVFTTTKEEHNNILIQVLNRLRSNDLFLKPEKCLFQVPQIEYLGLIITEGHLSMDSTKLSVITGWPTSRKVKDVQSFLEIGNFYCKFIQDFSRIATPLYKLT